MTNPVNEISGALGEEVARRLQALRDACRVAFAATGIKTTILFEVELVAAPSGASEKFVHAICNGEDQLELSRVSSLARSVADVSWRQFRDAPEPTPKTEG